MYIAWVWRVRRASPSWLTQHVGSEKVGRRSAFSDHAFNTWVKRQRVMLLSSMALGRLVVCCEVSAIGEESLLRYRVSL